MRFTRPQHLLDDPKFNIHNVPHYESKGYVQNDLYAREDDLKRDDMYNQRLETQENTNELRPTIIVPALAPIASPPSPVRPLISQSPDPQAGQAMRVFHQPSRSSSRERPSSSESEAGRVIAQLEDVKRNLETLQTDVRGVAHELGEVQTLVKEILEIITGQIQDMKELANEE
jgi:hypothetical protein